MSTVILGGGIIGISTAYYLSLQQQDASNPVASKTIHIVDSAPSLLLSASAFAGGFLALDWFAPASSSLGALSFRLHRELAEKNDGPRRWGYAGSHTYSVAIEEPGATDGKKVRGEDWLISGTSRSNLVNDRERSNRNSPINEPTSYALNSDGSPVVFTPQEHGTLSTIATSEECALVEPRELCEFLLSECRRRGVQVHLSSTAVEVVRDSNARLAAVKIASSGRGSDLVTELACQNLVLAAGAWTPRVFVTLFPQSAQRVPITPLAGHSLTATSPRYQEPFIEKVTASKHQTPGGDRWLSYSIYYPPCQYWPYAPEAYARLARGGETEIWVGGLNSSELPMPERADQVKSLINPESIQDLRKTLVQMVGKAKAGQAANEDDLTTVREALCFRPISETGTPYIGPVRSEDGVWIASGHGPWGITLSLGTGLVMSELLVGKKTSVDISGLGLPYAQKNSGKSLM